MLKVRAQGLCLQIAFFGDILHTFPFIPLHAEYLCVGPAASQEQESRILPHQASPQIGPHRLSTSADDDVSNK